MQTKLKTMKTQTTFAVALALTALNGCGNLTTQGSATEKAVCEIWGESLPTRSRSDTAQTQSEIQQAYADFLNTCPDWAHLLPGSGA